MVYTRIPGTERSPRATALLNNERQYVSKREGKPARLKLVEVPSSLISL
jgi:hypothetical protein